jgi:hypothetical protein
LFGAEDLTNKPTNKLLYDAIKDRGTAYLMVFRELKARYGEDEAKDVMRSASRAHGLYIGKSLAACAPRDFECMARGFAKSPDDGSVFCPDIRRLDSTCLEVKMMACPIKDAWVEAGCSQDEIVTDQQVLGVDLVAALTRTSAMCRLFRVERRFHLHRLDRDQHVAGLTALAGGDEDARDDARHRRADMGGIAGSALRRVLHRWRRARSGTLIGAAGR